MKSLRWALFVALCVGGSKFAAAQAPFQAPIRPVAFDYYGAEENDAPVASPSDLSEPPVPAAAAPLSAAPVDAGCCESLCDDCCCEPIWTARAGVLILHRQRPDDQVILEDAGGNAFLNANQFDMDYAAGPEISLSRAIGECWDFEVRYFGIDGWSATQSGAMTNPAIIPSPVPVVFIGASTYDATYSSELYNTELNLWKHSAGPLRWLAGFRYVELNEDLVLGADGPPHAQLDQQADNRLYGFQLGADAQLWDRGGRFRVDGVVKSGIYYNSVSYNSLIEFPPGTIMAQDADDASNTAFVGELGVNATYDLTDNLSLRGGYQMMWVTGVALASEQYAVTDWAAGTTPDTDGDVFYHGASAGLEYRW